MAIAGIGVDIVALDRIERALKRSPAFVRRVFWEDERHFCEHSSRKIAHYAMRWAAREAVVKALGTGFGKGIRYKDVEVCRQKGQAPFVKLHGKLKEHAESQGIIALHLSLSCTQSLAVANALALTEDALVKKEEKIDQKQILQSSFKEMRALIDGLEGM